MQPFYIMVFTAGLVTAALLFRVVGVLLRLGRPRRVLAYERREHFLNPQQQLCLGTIANAVGPDFRVFPRVAAGAVLAGDMALSRRRQRAAARALAGQAFDFVVCSAAEVSPLCAVVANPPEPSRRRRWEVAQLRLACADAGLPLVALTLADGYELTDIRRQLLDAIERAAERAVPTSASMPDPRFEPVASDEEALLAELDAAIQEPDEPSPAERLGH